MGFIYVDAFDKSVQSTQSLYNSSQFQHMYQSNIMGGKKKKGEALLLWV